MAVKLSRIWGDTNFMTLTMESKMFYIYLVTNPNINSVGVVLLNIELIKVHTGLSKPQVRKCTKELMSKDMIHVKAVNNSVYFIAPEHFHSMPKGDASKLRVEREMKLLEKPLREFLHSIGISASGKVKRFVKPSLNEVSEYAMSMGYKIDAKTFCDYYQGCADDANKPHLWLDSKGREVKNWKRKMEVVWFKPERKIKSAKGTPKGYEGWHVVIDGVTHTPDSWVNGKPRSNNFLINKEMNKVFNG